MSIDLHELPAWPQSQDSLSAQMASLILVANRFGLYDAADAVKQMTGKLDDLHYGCHVDLEQGAVPDGCVIDTGDYADCIYAKEGMRKEQCEYWRIVAQGEPDSELRAPATLLQQQPAPFLPAGATLRHPRRSPSR
jgi:hypothetical protein